MVAPNHMPPATILEVRRNGAAPPTLRANGHPLKHHRSFGSGGGIVKDKDVAAMFRIKPTAVQRLKTVGVRTAAGDVIRLESHGRMHGVPAHALSRFLRRLAECGPPASGATKLAPYGAYVIYGRNRVPLIVNGVPTVPMSEERYSELIGEPQPATSSEVAK
jgi:hypothetical protein